MSSDSEDRVPAEAVAPRPLLGTGAACPWEEEARSVGVDAELPVPFRIGVSALALAAFAGAIPAAYLVPTGAAPDPAGVGLVAVAGLPWAAWLLARRDNGPTWLFAALTLVPPTALGFGNWPSVPLGLAGEPAFSMAVFPVLLLLLLYAAFAPVRMAVGVVAAGYAAVTLPPTVGWLFGQTAVEVTGAVTWHMGFAFCVVAGYGVRFGHDLSKELGRAREALASQEAAEERRRIAQDVHDVVAHTLAVTMLHVTAARMAVRRSAPEEAQEALEEAERHGRSSLNDIRRVVRLLRSREAAGLPAPRPTLADVAELVESYRAAGLKVDSSIRLDASPDTATAELAVYRVMQESMANAARHGPGSATVDLRSDGTDILLTVENPVPPRAAASTTGSGLLGMRERIAAAGGTFTAGAREGRWRVHARIPYRSRRAQSPPPEPAPGPPPGRSREEAR